MRIILWLVSLSVLLAGCNWPGKPDPAQRPIPANKVMDFSTLFADNCSGCHGASGKMGPAPPLNDQLFLSIIPDKELRQVIREGRRGTPMPAFAIAHGGSLTDKQIDVIAESIKSRWGGSPPSLKTKPPPYLTPRESTEKRQTSIERGGDVFMRACMICHGEDGKGTKTDGKVALRINDPAFMALISDQALRRYVITGRPDLGMPNYAEKRPDDPEFKPLTATETDDVVALLVSWKPKRTDQGKPKPAQPAKGPESKRNQ
jgi:cytochrome c oxidase cbb3-type subunit 3